MYKTYNVSTGPANTLNWLLNVPSATLWALLDFSLQDLPCISSQLLSQTK